MGTGNNERRRRGVPVPTVHRDVSRSGAIHGRAPHGQTDGGLARIFHQDAELWRRTRRDRSGSTGAANRSFYWQDGMPDMAGQDPPESA